MCFGFVFFRGNWLKACGHAGVASLHFRLTREEVFGMGWVTKSSVISHTHQGAPNFSLGKKQLVAEAEGSC